MFLLKNKKNEIFLNTPSLSGALLKQMSKQCSPGSYRNDLLRVYTVYHSIGLHYG